MTRGTKRQAILKAAEELFMSRRFDQVTMEEVCAKAHVGKGTIYRHFENKEDLYSQLLLSGLDELYASLQRRVSANGMPDEELLAIARALQSFYRRREGLFRSLQAVGFRQIMGFRGLREEMCKRHRRIVGLAGAVIASGVRRGNYLSAIPTQTTARIFLAMAREAVRPRDGDGARPVKLERVVSLFLNGIRKR